MSDKESKEEIKEVDIVSIAGAGIKTPATVTPIKEKIKVNKWHRRMNTLNRNFDKFGNSLSGIKSRMQSAIKSASKKLGCGEEKYLDKVRKLQKRKLGDIHKQVYKDEQEDIKRIIVEKELKESIDALLVIGDNVVPSTPLTTPQTQSSTDRVAGSSSSSMIIITSSEGVLPTFGGKWTENSKVNRAVFLKRVSEFVDQSVLEWATVPSKKRQSKNVNTMKNGKFTFLNRRSGKPIHFLTTNFFTDTTFDDVETITWSAFKQTVFYQYLKEMSENLTKIKKEIRALEIVKRAFKELLSEVVISKAGKEEEKGMVTYGQLFNRLSAFEKTFDVSDDFWKLPCWAKENEDNLIGESDFNSKWIVSKSIEELKQTLSEFEDEQRSNLPIKSLILTGTYEDNFTENSGLSLTSSCVTADTGEDDSNETRSSSFSDQIAKKTSTSTSNGPAPTPGVSEAKKKFFKNIWSIKGVPKEIIPMYNKFSKTSRLILRRLVIVAKMVFDKALSSSTDVTDKQGQRLSVALELFRSNIILYDNALKEQQISITKAEEQYEQDVKLAKKNAKKGIDGVRLLTEEFEKLMQTLSSALDKLKDEKSKLNTLFHNNARKEFAALDITPSKNCDDYTLISRATFIQQGQIRKVAASATSSIETIGLLPSILDYSSEIHESFSQTLGDLGYLFVTLLIKEWQQYNATGSLERLSLEFLKSLIADYNGGSDGAVTNPTVVDALDVLKLHGICTDKEFKDFYGRKDRDSGKARSKVLTQALYNSVDEYFELESVDEIRSNLYYFGPLMVTLPVFDKFATHFWQKEPNGSFNLPSHPPTPPATTSSSTTSTTSSSSTTSTTSSSSTTSTSSSPNIRGGYGGGDAPNYHTVAVIGYNDSKKVFILRNSRGKSYGKFGNVEISYNDILKGSQVIAVTDKNRRVKREKIVDMDQVTSTILSGLCLVEYGNDKRTSSSF